MRSSPVPPDAAATALERRIGRLLLLPAATAIVTLTLMPSSGAALAALTPFWCLLCGDYGAVDVTLNTLLFLPFGLALALMGTPLRRTVGIALLTTLGIEFLQLAVIPGRDASISDILTNTAGGALGATIAVHWRGLVRPAPGAARRLLAAIMIGWIGMRVGTVWLLRPSFPDTTWYGQIAPRDVYPADFRGKVLAGAVGAVPVRVGLQPELHAPLRSATRSVRASVTGAQRTERLASIISVLDQNGEEMLVLGQEGDAARLRFRLRTADALLRTPSVRLHAALPGSATGVTELIGFLSPGRLSLSSAADGRAVEATIVLGPGLTWALLLPFDIGLTPLSAALGTAALAATILLLIGYFALLSLPRRLLRGAALTISLLAVGLWSPSLVFPEIEPALSEIVAAAVGAVIGLAIGRLTRQVQRPSNPRVS